MRNPREIQPGTIYICGPITGLPGLNFTAFAHAEERLNALGFNTINPHEIFRDVNTEGFEHADYMKHCISFLGMCDRVVCLEGWEQSIGASMEVKCSHTLGKPVHTLESFIYKQKHIA